MIYSFRNKETQDIQTIEMSMADRQPWLDSHKDWEQIIVKMTLADPMMLGIQSYQQKDFNRNVLGRMAASIPGNTLKHSRYNQNITEL
jgi:hypothetical protein